MNSGHLSVIKFFTKLNKQVEEKEIKIENNKLKSLKLNRNLFDVFNDVVDNDSQENFFKTYQYQNEKLLISGNENFEENANDYLLDLIKILNSFEINTTKIKNFQNSSYNFLFNMIRKTIFPNRSINFPDKDNNNELAFSDIVC